MIEPLTPRAGPALAAASIVATATPLILLSLTTVGRADAGTPEDWQILIGIGAVVGAPLAALFAAPIIWMLRRGLLRGFGPLRLGLLGAGAGLAYLLAGLPGGALGFPLSLPLAPATGALLVFAPDTWQDGPRAALVPAALFAGILLGGFLAGLVFARLAREPGA